MLDEESSEIMKEKDQRERLHREVVVASKLKIEKDHETQMKKMINKIKVKQLISVRSYNKSLNQKSKLAKDSLSKMDEVAQRAKKVRAEKEMETLKSFNVEVQKQKDKSAKRQELMEVQQWEKRLVLEQRLKH